MSDILTITMNPALEIATSVEHVVDTNKLRCGPEHSLPGGGGINVARVVNNMGGKSIAVFPFGGFTGQRLRWLLDKEHLTIHAIQVESETRQCFSIHETSTGRDFRFLLPGHELAASGLQACLAELQTLQPSPRYLVASGSLPPGVPTTFYSQLSTLAQNMGSRFVLDTSGVPLREALATGGIYLVKPSLSELEELTGLKLETEQARLHAARNVVKSGQAKLVALSLGSEGALLVSGHCAWRAASLPVTPVSTVGAGDSFVGGMVWALSCEMTIDDAFRYGIACATATILNPRAEMCQKADALKLYTQVRIESL
jgi:6-phosphofructokinase 2